MSVTDVFEPCCKNFTPSNQLTSLSLLDNLPNRNLKIAFAHPCDPKIKVFIDGKMPHLVEKIVNRSERISCPKIKYTVLMQV